MSPSSFPAILSQTEEASVTLDDRSSQKILVEAQNLLHQIITILHDPSCEGSGAARSFALARAHARTLLDHLARMSDPR